MFGNQYQQAVTDETALRRQSAQTGGMTGWAAITNAMSGIGSEIGYQGGQAMGGHDTSSISNKLSLNLLWIVFLTLTLQTLKVWYRKCHQLYTARFL